MAFATYGEAAVALRRFIGDTPQLNVLDGEFETTEDDLISYIKDTLIEINMDSEPRAMFTLKDIATEPEDNLNLSWSTVKLGSILQYLTSKGILNARNFITYSDTGGVQVSDLDRWGRYINYFNVLVNKYVAGVKAAKLRVNINDAYGGYSSPFSFDVY
jgi:hypothetical protein